MARPVDPESRRQRLSKPIVKFLSDKDVTYDEIKKIFKFVRKELGLKGKSVRKIPRYYELEDIQKIIDGAIKLDEDNPHVCIPRFYEMFIKTMFFSGTRSFETAELMYEDIDVINGTVTIRHGKGSKEGIVPIVPFFMEDLVSWMSQCGIKSGYLFHKLDGTKYSTRMIRNYVKYAINNSEISDVRKQYFKDNHMKCHAFRHGIATFLRKMGLPLEDIKSFLRHEKYDTTLIYAQIPTHQVRDKIQALFAKADMGTLPDYERKALGFSDDDT